MFKIHNQQISTSHSFTGSTDVMMLGSVVGLLVALICGVANAADYRETSCFYLYKDGQESAKTPCKYSYYEDFQRNRKTSGVPPSYETVFWPS